MKQDIVNVFTDQIFHGNQAAICVPDRWPPRPGLYAVRSRMK